MRTDMNCITIVYQDELGGLQVRSKDGQWVDIFPCEGTLVVNIGDMLQAWSNDKLRSSEHRVVLKKPVSCFSLVFFCCFENEKVILAPDEVVGEENSRIYKPFVFYDYLNFRVNCFSLVFFCYFENEKVILAPDEVVGCEDRHRFSMYFFLPDAKDGLPALVNKVSYKSFLLKRHLRYQKVGVSEFRTPKFKISFGFEASNVLKGHGVVLSFSGNGLTEMMDSAVGSNFYVCIIFHKPFTEVGYRLQQITYLMQQMSDLFLLFPMDHSSAATVTVMMVAIDGGGGGYHVTFLDVSSLSAVVPKFRDGNKGREQGPKPQGSVSSTRINLLCQKCGVNHQGVYRASSDICFKYGKPGHKGAASSAISGQHLNRLYALQSRQDQESSPDVVTGALQVYHLHVYDLLGLETSLLFVTPYIAVNFRVSPEILAEPFSVSTLVARRVYMNCPVMVSWKVTSAD
ncbi:Serpin-ZX [Capsicum baccatum]|uniref:Serpin-ZX n=1 Tax=Capsicum baccatum TaxID=33114 RepID=A0A2G2WCG0_CAPBA|nr:Serpin-ZX [Capsicum baccatum]